MLCLGLNFGKSFNEQAQLILEYGSVTASLTITLILSKIRLNVMGYAMLILMTVRIAVTLLELHFITQNFSGFELIDKKSMSDIIPFHATPAMILAICNLKFNLFLTVPMVFVSSIYVIQLTLSAQDDNLSCFKKPDSYANTMSER